MLIGEYIHGIDEKNRVSLPAKFRQEMGKKVVLAKGVDNCLSVFTPKEWANFSQTLSQETLRKDNRGFNRLTFGGAMEAEVDSIGRILVPDFLIEWASLKGKVAIIGVQNKVEIWNEKTWVEYRRTAEKQMGSFAENVTAH